MYNHLSMKWMVRNMKSLILILLALLNFVSFLQYDVGRRVNHYIFSFKFFSKCRNSLKYPNLLSELILLIFQWSVPMGNHNRERCEEKIKLVRKFIFFSPSVPKRTFDWILNASVRWSRKKWVNYLNFLHESFGAQSFKNYFMMWFGPFILFKDWIFSLTFEFSELFFLRLICSCQFFFVYLESHF